MAAEIEKIMADAGYQTGRPSDLAENPTGAALPAALNWPYPERKRGIACMPSANGMAKYLSLTPRCRF